ncbi:MAG: hypothetical protein V1799_15570 [bacterium]
MNQIIIALALIILPLFSDCCFVGLSTFTPGQFAREEKPRYAKEPITRKVLILIYDPIISSKGNKKLHEILRWNNPDTLAYRYIRDVHEASWGIVNYMIVEQIELNEYPIHTDGYRYNDSTFFIDWNRKRFYPQGGDYKAIIKEFDLVKRIESKEIDEVWMFGAPGFGWWESLMVGKGAYFCNSDPLTDIDCNRRFVVMGFNYERGVDCMLENLGHRIESILWHIYGTWEANKNTSWNHFTLYDKNAPGQAQCGNIHFAPNSTRDYEWGNPMYVMSGCDDWYSYPTLTGKIRRVNCEEWGNGDMRLHHIWWFKHLPRAEGLSDGKLNNWWQYVMKVDEFD